MVSVPVMDSATCAAKYKDTQFTVHDHNICAGVEEGGKDACTVRYKFVSLYGVDQV